MPRFPQIVAALIMLSGCAANRKRIDVETGGEVAGQKKER